jgi:hypothetical protein
MEPEKRMTPFGASLFPLKRWIVVVSESYMIYTFAKDQTPRERRLLHAESSIGNLGGECPPSEFPWREFHRKFGVGVSLSCEGFHQQLV